MICDECETVAHCMKNGCVPKTNVQQEPVAWMNAKRDMTYLYGPYNADDIPLYTSPLAQRQARSADTWVGLIRGVRVDGDALFITVKGGNDAARELCGALLKEKNRD